jgi:hypothetical protein
LTETRATSGADDRWLADPAQMPARDPVFPAGRYGRRRAPRRQRRWLTVAVAVVVLLAAAVVAIRLYRQYGQLDYQPTVRRLSEVSDSGISVEFEVRKPADREATCRVRARAATGEEVGYAEVDAPKGDRVVVTVRVPTSKRPRVAEVLRCGPKP